VLELRSPWSPRLAQDRGGLVPDVATGASHHAGRIRRIGVGAMVRKVSSLATAWREGIGARCDATSRASRDLDYAGDGA
jgi:hypothetical protein